MSTITTAEVNKKLGLSLSTDFIKNTLEVEPAEIGRAGHPRWWQEDLPLIRNLLVDHLQALKFDAPEDDDEL